MIQYHDRKEGFLVTIEGETKIHTPNTYMFAFEDTKGQDLDLFSKLGSSFLVINIENETDQNKPLKGFDYKLLTAPEELILEKDKGDCLLALAFNHDFDPEKHQSEKISELRERSQVVLIFDGVEYEQIKVEFNTLPKESFVKIIQDLNLGYKQIVDARRARGEDRLTLREKTWHRLFLPLLFLGALLFIILLPVIILILIFGWIGTKIKKPSVIK